MYSAGAIGWPLGRMVERLAVRRGAGDRRRRNGAAGAEPAFHHDRLAEPLAQPFGHDARRDVDVGAGREAVHQRDRAAGLRARGRGERGGRGKAGEGGAAGDLFVIV